MALSRTQWEEFLATAGIPDEDAKKYAQSFVDNRIRHPSHIEKDILKKLGVTVIGDVLAIMKQCKKEAPQVTKEKHHFKPSIELPRLRHDLTPAEFRKFKTDWHVYKTITQLPEEQIAPQLYSACEPDLQTSIINTSKDFLQLDEEINMQTLEHLVTRQSNPAVHRLNFGNLCQSENEPINSFLIRVKSTSKDCSFECPECHYDLSPIHIKDQLIRGLHNSALQTDILAKSGCLKTLEDVVKHAQSYETALFDQSKLSDSVEAIQRVSSYKKTADQQHI